MVKVDKEKLKDILLNELDYKPSSAEMFAKWFPDELPEELREVYEQWMQDRTVLETPIAGVSVPELMRVSNQNFPISIRSMNILLGLEGAEREKYKDAIMSPHIIW